MACWLVLELRNQVKHSNMCAEFICMTLGFRAVEPLKKRLKVQYAKFKAEATSYQ